MTTPPPAAAAPADPAAAAAVDRDLRLLDHAADLLDALLASADVDVVGAARWWDRATSALVTGASTGTHLRAVADRMAAKLQIGALRETTAATVLRLADALADPDDFARFAQLAVDDQWSVVGAVRLRRAARRTTTPRTTPAPAPAAPAGTADTLEF